MSRISQRILPLLAIIAMAGAQVFGLQRGYICDHHESEIITSAEHCHVDDSATSVVVSTDCHSDVPNDCHQSGEREHHEPATVDHHASHSGLGGKTITPPMMVMSVEHWLLQTLRSDAWAQGIPAASSFSFIDKSPPSCLQVARCVVRLV